MIENEIATLIYAGQFDMQDGPKSMVWMQNIKELYKRDPSFWIDARKIYLYNLNG